MLNFFRRYPAGSLTALAVLALDQMTKQWVVQTLAVGESWPQGGFWITHVVNTGSAFGLFAGYTPMLIVASVVSLGVLLVLYWPFQRAGLGPQLSFGMMLAGAAGNLVDRISIGYVTDFIDVLPWCIFNLADTFVVLGFLLFMYTILRQLFANSRLPRG